jgi:hypothetical protein
MSFIGFKDVLGFEALAALLCLMAWFTVHSFDPLVTRITPMKVEQVGVRVPVPRSNNFAVISIALLIPSSECAIPSIGVLTQGTGWAYRAFLNAVLRVDVLIPFWFTYA